MADDAGPVAGELGEDLRGGGGDDDGVFGFDAGEGGVPGEGLVVLDGDLGIGCGDGFAVAVAGGAALMVEFPLVAVAVFEIGLLEDGEDFGEAAAGLGGE